MAPSGSKMQAWRVHIDRKSSGMQGWSDAAAWAEVEIMAVAQEEGNRKEVSSLQLGEMGKIRVQPGGSSSSSRCKNAKKKAWARAMQRAWGIAHACCQVSSGHNQAAGARLTHLPIFSFSPFRAASADPRTIGISSPGNLRSDDGNDVALGGLVER